MHQLPRHQLCKKYPRLPVAYRCSDLTQLLTLNLLHSLLLCICHLLLLLLLWLLWKVINLTACMPHSQQG
jgi:hypothetical protein